MDMSSGRKTISDLFAHITNNDWEEIEYLYNWVAHALQKPRRQGHHLIFNGQTGTGKGIFTGFLELVFKMKDEDFLTLSTYNPKRECWGKFNPKMDNVGLVVLNEVRKEDFKINRRDILGMIANSHIRINHRYGEMYYIDNNIRLVSQTNEPGLDFNLEDEEYWRNKVINIEERMSQELAKNVKSLTVVDYANFYQEMMEREAHEMVV